MLKLFKLHKFFGLLVGLLLLILGLTGFFINHKQWNFLYTTTFNNMPNSTLTEDKKLVEAYLVDNDDTDHIIVGGKRGIYETFDEGDSYSKMSDLQCLALKMMLPQPMQLHLMVSIYSKIKNGTPMCFRVTT